MEDIDMKYVNIGQYFAQTITEKQLLLEDARTI